MGQVTIYLDNEIENKLKKAAKASKQSVSKWVAAIINEKVSTEWPENIADLAGSWKTDFPSLDEIRSTQGIDAKREDF
jgi:predicted transcriptional regulator